MITSESRIYIAGASGMVGRAVTRRLTEAGYRNLTEHQSSDVLDLRVASAVDAYFQAQTPEVVIVAAARVGGILANQSHPADFIADNLAIELNLIQAAFKRRVEKLIFLGSSCIYPRLAKQPISEEELLCGPLEPSNEPYAIAKITGIKLCESFYRQHGCNYLSLMPTNLYGQYDNFDLNSSHVIPALIRKFDDAKTGGSAQVTVWGTGRPKREFLYVDDLADAVLFAMKNIDAKDIYSAGISHLNVGSGEEISISDLAEAVQKVVGYEGPIEYDGEKPDGTPGKLMDSSRIRSLGWKPNVPLTDGLRRTYDWYLKQKGGFATA